MNWGLPGLLESRKNPVVVVGVQAEESSPAASDARWLMTSLEETMLAVVIWVVARHRGQHRKGPAAVRWALVAGGVVAICRASD